MNVIVRSLLAVTLASAGAVAVGASAAQAAPPTTGVITGRIGAAAGGPAANIRVVADDYNTARTFETTTSATGRYSLRVPPGTDYVVRFVDGHFGQYSPHTTEQSEAGHYQVRAGRTLRINDRLLPAASLTGRLTDAAGAPVAGASVRFLTETAFELQTTTDADGRYSFEKLTPWHVKVAFRAPDGRRQWAYQKASYDEATEFALSLGTVTTVDDVLLP